MKYAWARAVYFYLVSLITLIIIVINTALLVNLAIKVWVFPRAGLVESAQRYGPPPSFYPTTVDATTKVETQILPQCKDTCEFTDTQKAQMATWLENYENWRERTQNITGQRQLDAVRAISFLIVVIPIFIYHWMIVRRDAARTRREAAGEDRKESEI